MNILIIGAGYIGNNLNQYLKSQGHSVAVISRAKLDYSNGDKLYDKLISAKQATGRFPDTIINTAGFTGKPNVDQCEEEKELCYKLNAILPRDIEKVCSDLGINFIHISSGCIYTGYEKEYNEDDEPNFGLYSKESSFYSLTKHAGELGLDKKFTNIIRIRMPIEGKLTDKNLLTKLKKYNNLIDFKNSKTDLFTLCEFIETVADNFKSGIYNAVHSNTLTTKQVIDIMKEYGIDNKKWKIVEYEDLDIKCNRSNCVLTNKKAKEDFGFDWGDEEYYVRANCEKIKNDERV